MNINYLASSLVYTSQTTDTGKAHLYSSCKNQGMMTKNAFLPRNCMKIQDSKWAAQRGTLRSVCFWTLSAFPCHTTHGGSRPQGFVCLVLFRIVVRRRHTHVLSITSPLSFREIQPQIDFFAFFPKGVSWCPYLNVCKFHANSSFCLPCASKVPDAALETFASVK